MKCPVDETVLQMTERRGVEIDYCPECRGVWLDRGELDKIIEADRGSDPGPAGPRHQVREQPRYDEHSGGPDRGYERGYDMRQRAKRKKSLIGELFDF